MNHQESGSKRVALRASVAILSPAVFVLACSTTSNAATNTVRATSKSSVASTAKPVTQSLPRTLTVPYICQFSPKGKDSNYKNGDSNCGPTSMAMIARFYKYSAGSNLTDAQLVTQLNLADGKATGATDADGIKAMGAKMGKPVTQHLGPDLTLITHSLRANL